MKAGFRVRCGGEGICGVRTEWLGFFGGGGGGWCEHNVGSDMVCNCCSYLCSAHEAICRLFERRQEPPMLSLSGAFVC